MNNERVIKFGQYSGTPISQLPLHYAQWLLREPSSFALDEEDVRQLSERVGEGQTANASLATRHTLLAYRVLLLEERVSNLEEDYNKLKEILSEVINYCKQRRRSKNT